MIYIISIHRITALNGWTINTKLYFFKYEEVLQPWNQQQILGFNKIGEKSKGHEL